MIRAYVAFTLRNARFLGFAAVLLLLSSVGQTFFISLFGDDFRSAFGLTNSRLGMIYTLATFASALALPPLGVRIDRMETDRYVWRVGAFVAVGCLLVAFCPHAILLWLALLCVRLGGQGLLIHTAFTATARAFPADSGKALAVVSLAFSGAQVIVPIATVFALDHLDWRWVWCVAAAVVVAGTPIALRLAGSATPAEPAAPATDPASASAPVPDERWQWGKFLLALPAMLAVSFIWSGLLFHQTSLASEKGWSLTWMAGWFAGFAVTQAVISLVAGSLIDRIGSTRVVGFFLIPHGLGLLLLAFSESQWAVPAYLVLTGISAAIDIPLGTTLWAELYGHQHLGRTRSLYEAIRIISTGSSPFLMGVLLDHGVSLSVQARGCALYIAAATLLSLALRSRSSRAEVAP